MSYMSLVIIFNPKNTHTRAPGHSSGPLPGPHSPPVAGAASWVETPQVHTQPGILLELQTRRPPPCLWGALGAAYTPPPRFLLPLQNSLLESILHLCHFISHRCYSIKSVGSILTVFLEQSMQLVRLLMEATISHLDSCNPTT